MNETHRLELEKMIKANNVEDCTKDIRSKQHSEPLRKDVHKMLTLKKQYRKLSNTNPEKFDAILVENCPFLFNHYTDIFNRIKKDVIDLNILLQLINVLKKIEMHELDQHAGSFEDGKLLKSIYIDSALRKVEKLDDERDQYDNTTTKTSAKPKKICWRDYKKKHITFSK